jgi:hypothetical protein
VTPPPLATLDDFESWPGVVIASGQEVAAEAVLAAVSARVRDLAGETWVDEDDELEDVPDVIVGIVQSVALRVWVNPDARSSSSTGPYSAAWATLGLSFTAEEVAAIKRAGGVGWSGIGTIGTSRGPLETRPVVDSGLYSGVYEELNW